MDSTADICHSITSLSSGQMNYLQRLCGLLPLAGDLAHAQATVYVKARQGSLLVIAAQASPSTTSVKDKAYGVGSCFSAGEEPLVWRTMVTGIPIAGQREWALGFVADMHTFPLYDPDGQIIAVVSFETGGVETVSGHASSILMESAHMLLTLAEPVGDISVYRRLLARDGIMIADAHGEIIFANAAANSIYNMLGLGRIVGRHVYDRRINLRLAQKAAAELIALEEQFEQDRMVFIRRAIPIIKEGAAVRTIIVISDITEQKQKEKELLVKSAVIQEIHHRVKNNLQTIASLLRLQARRTTSPEVKAALRESVNRILSISVVHEFLSQQDQEVIDIAEVARNILDQVIQNMIGPDFTMETVFHAEAVIMPSEQATSVALVINELIQNSIEHGFAGRNSGRIGIDMAVMPDAYTLTIYDNGAGLPDNFANRSSASLGLQIVRTLIETDLGGQFELTSQGGVHARIVIPKASEEV